MVIWLFSYLCQMPGVWLGSNKKHIIDTLCDDVLVLWNITLLINLIWVVLLYLSAFRLNAQMWSLLYPSTCGKTSAVAALITKLEMLTSKFIWPLMIYITRLNTLRLRQNGRHFADDISKCIFLNENVWFFIKISLKFVLKGQINKVPSLVQIMAWRRPGDKPLSEPMMVSSPMHICVIRPQWVK